MNPEYYPDEQVDILEPDLRVVHRIKRDAPGSFPEYMFFCPGCKCGHGFKTDGNSPCWTFNGDLVKPTIQPSIIVTGTQPITDEQYAILRGGGKVEKRPLVCHVHVREGMIQFLDDCTHELKGTTVPLEPF